MIDFIYRRWAALSFLVLVLISIASLLPLAQLPQAPGSDKTHHLFAYGGLAIPIVLRGHRLCLAILGTAFAWSGLIELIQPHFNRYGEWLDWFANGLGLLLGGLLGLYLRKYVNHSRERRDHPDG